jgi:hypothetical protein
VRTRELEDALDYERMKTALDAGVYPVGPEHDCVSVRRNVSKSNLRPARSAGSGSARSAHDGPASRTRQQPSAWRGRV